MKENDQMEDGAVSRRIVLRAALGGMGLAAFGPRANALALASTLRPQASGAQQKFLVVIELDGGNDGLNTVVPHTLANYTDRRPTLALGASDTLPLDSGPFSTSELRLHGRMPRLGQMYRDGELGIISKVGYPSISGSHDGSKKVWYSGERNGTFTRGWVAGYKDAFAPDTNSAVGLARGAHPTLAGGVNRALALNSLSNLKFDADGAFSNNHQHRLDIIRSMLEGQSDSIERGALLTAHELTSQVDDAVASFVQTGVYPNGTFGTAMRDIAIMLQADFPTRIFYTGLGGFDTHAAQGGLAGTHGDRLESVDGAVYAFSEDCKAMGVWGNCLIAVVSEFGRRNFENGSGGTDHGKGNTVLLAGGAMRGGLHGELPSNEDLAEPSLPYAIDFRLVYKDILTNHLGVQNADAVFSEPFQSPAGVNLFA